MITCYMLFFAIYVFIFSNIIVAADEGFFNDCRLAFPMCADEPLAVAIPRPGLFPFCA